MDVPLLLMVITAGFFNLVLLPSVIYFSKYAIGSFKLMMIAIALVNQLTFFWGLFSRPSFFLDDYTILIYAGGSATEYGSTMAFIAVVISFDAYPAILINQLLQFVYRYIALCKIHLRGYLNIKYLLLAIVAGLMISFTLTSALCCLFFYPDEDVWAHVNGNTLKYLNKAASSLQGPAIMYLKSESSDFFSIRWTNCIGVVLFFLFSLLITSAGIVLAVKIHRSLNQTLISNQSKFIHRTMFHMLIVQSMVPLFFHLPAVAIFFTPLFFPAYDKLNFATYVVLAAPLLEPLVAVYFLNARTLKKSYLRFFRRKRSLGSAVAPAVSPSSSRGLE